jgi:hypothetical protein
MVEMYVTDESPSSITLATDPDWKAETSKTYADSLKQGRGCWGIVAAAFLFFFAVIEYSRSTHSLDLLPWSFWAMAVFVFIGSMLFILFEIYFVTSHGKEAEEATVTIDLDAQRVIRVEKLYSGKTRRMELPLGQVTQVSIHGDDAIHMITIALESHNGPSFNLASDVFFDSKPMVELGRKIGSFLQKPVLFKIMEAGKLISEEAIQP